jgi:superfamily II DNA or RNA helicase
MSPIELRPYQHSAVAKTLAAYEDGKIANLLVLATGLGKTLTAAQIIAERGGRALFLAHTDELIEQTIETLSLLFDPLDIGKVKAESNELHSRITVASIQTLSRPNRLKELLESEWRGPFRTVVADEAHFSMAPTWRRVLEALGIKAPRLAGSKRRLFVGLTATPERLDKVGLHYLWGSEPTFSMGILDGILSTPQYLCDLRTKSVPAFNLSSAKVTAGDYNDGSLAETLLEQHGPEQIVEASLKYAAGRKKLVFLPTINFADVVTLEYQANGTAAALVTGETPKDERRELIHAFRLGQIEALCNVNVLSYGFDAPVADCAVLGRPTRSRTLFTQQIGRITRMFPGKVDGLILDLVGNTQAHKIVNLGDITGIDPRDGESVKERLSRAAEADNEKELAITAARSSKNDSLFSTLPWQPLPNGSYGLARSISEAFYLVPDETEHCTVWRLRDGKREPVWPTALRIDYAQGMVEGLARKEGWLVHMRTNSRHRQQPATDYMRSQLRQRLIEDWSRPDLTQGEARDILDHAQLVATVTATSGAPTRPW